MVIDTIGAIGNGVSMPLMSLLMVSLKFVYLAVGAAAAAFLQVTCWMVTGERQAARIRGYYLKTILRQDVSFFDKETNTGEVVGIQDAMGEKVGNFLQLMATCLGGFTIAFAKGWLMALVMLSAIPLLVTAGATVSILVSRMATRGQSAYAELLLLSRQLALLELLLHYWREESH
ncbi:ABC transporter B family member 11-like isoform X2 [Euphorbia lathyris]|uniref:ABC transporter B family member 11-like isoform X2 n=1 Tax=Euphorbia lathyris TaxID=212925 RepID=UPI003314208E